MSLAKTRVKMYSAYLNLGETYQIESKYSVYANTVLLTDGHYIENPFDTFDEAKWKKFIVTASDISKDEIEIALVHEPVTSDVSDVKGLPTCDKWDAPVPKRWMDYKDLKSHYDETRAAIFNNASAYGKSDFMAMAAEDIYNKLGGTKMNGYVYTGVVVRTKTVAAGEGVTTGVEVSEIVYTTPKAFIAPNDDSAKAVILAQAIVAVGPGLDVTDVRQPVTVRLQKS